MHTTFSLVPVDQLRVDSMDNVSSDRSSETASGDERYEGWSPVVVSSSETSLENSILLPDENDSEYMSFPTLPTSVDWAEPESSICHDFTWPCSQELQKEQRKHSHATFEALVYAAWALLASRMTGAEKVGFDIAHYRPTEASLHLTRPLLIKCDLNQSVREYFQAVQARAAASEAQCLTIKSESRFRTCIIIQKDDPVDVKSKITAGYALILEMNPQQDGLHAVATYDARILESWMVSRLLRSLEFYVGKLLAEVEAAVVAVAGETSPTHGATTLSELEALSPHDLHQIWQWNGELPVAVERCMHDIFRDQALSQPNALVIDAWDGRLTYAELDQLSDQVAGHLIRLGVKTEVIVPLCFEKSMWMPVAMLGVLKAGGAFCLLEPSFPEQRLRTIVEEVHAIVVLSSSTNMPLTSQLLDNVVRVDAESVSSFVADPTREPNAQNSSTAMFAVFTSGSTGKPKGAILTHTNYSSALTHQLQLLGFTRESRIFDFASYAFDVSVHNVFATFTSGACLCIPSDHDRRNNIAQSMTDFGVTIAHLTPSVTRLLEPEAVPSLQTMVFTGEPLSIDEAARWWGKVRVVNEYGPAECTINTVNSSPITPEAATKIGPPVGVAGWIVDPQNHDSLAPVGCVGELLIEGALVGRGYINDETKTSAAFIEDPKWLLQGAPGWPGRKGRLYKTGDLVRYNEDGSLNIIGRKDVQVKIRGQRVDLGEVEHWIKSCVTRAEQVVAEVIIPQGHDPSSTLVAFIQSQEIEATEAQEVHIRPVPEEVQRKLSQHLPSYIVPTVLFWMAQLPMTPTGKRDRKRLREIGSAFTVDELAEARAADQINGPKRLPSSEMELRIREIWARVLGVASANIGLDDNFFHLGGDSIASMRVVGEARKLRIQVNVADTFLHPSLHELAQHCHQVLDSLTEHIPAYGLLGEDCDHESFVRGISHQYKLDPAMIEDAYPCTRLQEGLMFLTSKRPGDYLEQSVLELASDVSLDRLREAWEQAVKAEPILRTRLVHHNDLGLLQLVLDDRAHWAEVTGLDEYLAADRKQSMNLGDALSRFALVRDDQGTTQWLVWTVHHAIYDGWSIRLVTDAVTKAYFGEELESGPQFQTFIKYVQEQDSQRATEYWQKSLEGFDAAPFPRPTPSVDQPIADSVVKHVIPNPRNNRDGITTSMLIRAAWALVVGRTANSDDVVFGSTLYGRNAAVTGLNDMVAPTIATVPVRVQFSADQRVSEFLDAIQHGAVEMMPYEQTGLQKIATFSPAAQRACQFQTHVVIQPADGSQGETPLGRWTSGGQEQWFSTYALTLELWLGAEGISASAMFDSRLIQSWTVQGMLERLEWVMYQLDHAGPAQMLSEVQMATADDLEQIWQWNETMPERVDRCVHDLLAGQVEARPQSLAVYAWDGKLTYSKLDELSTRLSQHLQTLGTTSANTLVPLCFEKCLWTTVAMLGVLKAGAGFILLDPHLPEQRLQSIMQQVKSDLIVTSPSQQDLSLRLAKKTVVLGWDFFTNLDTEEHQPILPANPSSIAYAIFTSGSTGTPKGVMISHANAVSAQHHQSQMMGHTPETRLLDFASYSFDVAISNIFSVLACGGCLCVPSEDDRKNHLEQSIISLRVNALDLTPSTIQLLSPDRLPDVRLLTLGGEPLRSRDIQDWCGKVRICNAYGPSECTPTCTINYDIQDPHEASHVGRGAGALTWIVNPDNHDELLPPGCTGELLIEGPVVGLGYLNDPVKTTASFIEDPAWLLQGPASRAGRHGRLYKTGDLMKYREDGSLIYVGRKDAQVKVRGQRIEPGEIEAVLRSHERVDDAVVVPQDEGGQEPWLAGFVTVNGDGRVRVTEAEQLPERKQSPGRLEQKVQSWENQFDETYSSIRMIQPEMIGRDFVGWSSMYDGAEINKDEMNEWLDDTIHTIVNGRPVGNVLEIGTGSGMMLFNLGRYGLREYVGIEPSARAVDFVVGTAKLLPDFKDKVSVFKGTAEDIHRLDRPLSPNLVILNSVIQYFPSQDYLFHIIRDLLRFGTVETIFLGDVRSFALHKEFLARRTLHIKKDGASLEEFSNILGNLEQVEPELLLDPGFFTSLPDRLPGIRHVEIIPKRMRATNELSSYRYAAVLHVNTKSQPKPRQEIQEIRSDCWIDYVSLGLNHQSLLNLLNNRSASPIVAVKNIPYSKTAFETCIVDALGGNERSCLTQQDSTWLWSLAQASQDQPCLSAFGLAEIAQQAGCIAEISWARQHSQRGGLDVVFQRINPSMATSKHTRRRLFRFPTDHNGRSYASLSSNPLRQQSQTKLDEQLQDMLRSRLPSYMVPQTITILDQMPVNHNGKVDRRSLSALIKRREEPTEAKQQPSTSAEQQLQAIWSRVLDLPPAQIGLDDGFIQLGGNSLSAMKAVKLAREAGINLDVADMFRHTTTSIRRLLSGAHTTSSSAAAAVTNPSHPSPRPVQTHIPNGSSPSTPTPRSLAPPANPDRLLSEISRYDRLISSLQLSSRSSSSTHLPFNPAFSARDPGKPAKRPLTIALTGATGFIGTQLLRQLLEHGSVGRVIAIARGTGSRSARERTIEAAKRAQWWTEFHAQNLEVWEGDLALPRLGVEESKWREIAEGGVDVFVHNGAAVHFVKSYEVLEAANVGSTAEMIAVVARREGMRLVYVASARHGEPDQETEEVVARGLAKSPNGYNETKFVAEALVRRAAGRGEKGKFAVVSPGLVVGTPTEGVANADDWIWRMAAACVRVGVCNADEAGQWMPVADAADVAATVVATAVQPSDAVVTQVKGGLTMGEFWATLRTLGYELRGTDAGQCVAAIRTDVQNNPDTHPLGVLAGMLEELGNTTQEQWAESWHHSQSSSPTRLRVALAKSVQFLSRVGFLPQPAAMLANGGNTKDEVAITPFIRSSG